LKGNTAFVFDLIRMPSFPVPLLYANAIRHGLRGFFWVTSWKGIFPCWMLFDLCWFVSFSCFLWSAVEDFLERGWHIIPPFMCSTFLIFSHAYIFCLGYNHARNKYKSGEAFYFIFFFFSFWYHKHHPHDSWGDGHFQESNHFFYFLINRKFIS